jgi:quercetin dioxygenase-like cupin family protein
MSPFKVDFESMQWREVRPGVRHKVFQEGARQIRLVEFASGDADPHWCDRGHIGYVLEGALAIEFNDAVHSFAAGDGLFIPSGAASAHRGVSITPGTKLLMVEDV